MDPFLGASEKPSETGKLTFQHVPIDVVTEVSKLPIPQLDSGSPVIDYQTIEDDGLPALDQLDPFDFRQPEAEAGLEYDEVKDLVVMLVNIPSMFGLQHLERTKIDCAPFAKELHRYCEKKGIDPREYVFDELPIIMTGLALGGGMWKDQKAYKKEHKTPAKKIDTGTGIEDSYSRTIPEPEDPPEARPEKATLTDGVGIGLGGRG